MNIKNKYKYDKNLLFITFIIIGILLCMIGTPSLCLFYATILFAYILFRAKITFISELSFILLFSYLQQVIRYYYDVEGSFLYYVGIKIPMYMSDFTISIISLFIILIYFIDFKKIAEKERAFYTTDLGISQEMGIVLIIVSCILTVLLFPSIPTFVMNTDIRRSQGISGMYGFMLTALVIASLTFDLSYKHKYYNLAYLFIILWTVGHAERVEIIGFVSLYAMKTINRLEFSNLKNSVKKRKKRLIWGLSAIFLLIFAWVGIYRNSNSGIISFESVVSSLFVQGTAGDVVYVFNAAADMWHSGHGLYGLTYIDYVAQLVPGISTPYSFATLILEKYSTNGGSLFFSEPMANFGIIGVLITNFTFVGVLYLFLNKRKKIKIFMWFPIVLEVFRIAWYGRSVWILAAFIEAPFMYFLIYGEKKIRPINYILADNT